MEGIKHDQADEKKRTSDSEKISHSQWELLATRRLGPLFVTQFTGAFNDNLYKSALLMLFTYGGISRYGIDINIINNLVAATMIIPFLIFASVAGQFADKYEKNHIITKIKLAEILIMSAGVLAFWFNSAAGLLLVLFFTGTQSACFSPLKYSIVPQLTYTQELVGANGLIHMGTSISVFLGLICGSIAVNFEYGVQVVAWAGLLLAVCGWAASKKIPSVAAQHPRLTITFNPFVQTVRTIRYARENPMVFWSIIGISWYWFLGSIYLTQLPNLTRSVLGGDKPVVTLLLFLFLIGLASGALLCEWISRRKVEPGIVPFGLIGVIFFGADLYFAAQTMTPPPEGELLGIADLIVQFPVLRIMGDILLLGMFGGVYSVPLISLMQTRCEDNHRAQVVGANNVINAVFMVLAAVLGMLVLGVMKLTIPEFFLFVVVLTAIFGVVLMVCIPEFYHRFIKKFIIRGHA